MKTKLLTNLLVLLLFLVKAQTAPELEWQKTYGGSSYDAAFSVQQTSDGGYIIVGSTLSNDGDIPENKGAYDIFLLKTTSNGSIVWKKTFGGSSAEYGRSVKQTSDGGYIIGGQTFSNDGDVSGNHGDRDFWILKLDHLGSIQWQKTLGGTNNDELRSIQPTADGGYIAVGGTFSINGNVTGNHGESDLWVVKLSSTGDLSWQKTFGGSATDYGTSIQQNTNGDYYISGYTNSNDGDVSGNHGNFDFWVLKLNSSGILQWQKTLGGSAVDFGWAISQTTDGGCVVTGETRSNDGDVTGLHGSSSDFWVVKLDSAGAMQWQKTLGGSSTDVANTIQQTNDGGYVVAGQTQSSNGDVTQNNGASDFWVVKLNAMGNLSWQKNLGGSFEEFAYSIQKTSNNGFIVAGYSVSNNGDVSGNQGGADFWVVKLSGETLATQNTPINDINIYPNPVKDVVYFSEKLLKIKICDPSGKLMMTQQQAAQKLNVNQLSAGIYVIQGQTNEGQIISKQIIKK